MKKEPKETWLERFREYYTRKNEWLVDVSPLDVEHFIGFEIREAEERGMAKEAINCHEHEKKARLDVIRKVREWVKKWDEDYTPEFYDDLLTYLDTLGKEL